ncbi:hypothetical protein ZWY2020_008284 [Hordeum vulgare]|nr:hypothetical protein ZWY2020_008284 [Hordeum vulgare]
MGGDGGHAATAAVLGNENLLHQILIHVGYPTSLLCAALVCKQWLRHVTDPDFLHGFHGRHDLGCHSRRQLRRLRQLAMEEARPQQTAGLATPLRLDDLELPVPARGKVPSIQPWTARADVVTRALASQPGPVALFRLSRTSFRGRVDAAEAWFRQLAAKHAREASLFFSPEWCHDALADPLLGCPTLQVLALGKCHLSDAGASAVAAAALTELTLSETCISEAALQSVLSVCPALRSLMLKHVNGLQRIRVYSCRSLVLLGVWHYK